jgi:hypothetical protein
MESLKEVLDAHAESIIKGLGAEFDSHDFMKRFLAKQEKNGRTQSTNIKGYKSENQRWKKVLLLIPLLAFLCNFSALGQYGRFEDIKVEMMKELDERAARLSEFYSLCRKGSYKDIKSLMPRATKYVEDKYPVTKFNGIFDNYYFRYNVTDEQIEILDEEYLESGKQSLSSYRSFDGDPEVQLRVSYQLLQDGIWYALIHAKDLRNLDNTLLSKEKSLAKKSLADKQEIEKLNQVRKRNNLPPISSLDELKKEKTGNSDKGTTGLW